MSTATVLILIAGSISTMAAAWAGWTSKTLIQILVAVSRLTEKLENHDDRIVRLEKKELISD